MSKPILLPPTSILSTLLDKPISSTLREQLHLLLGTDTINPNAFRYPKALCSPSLAMQIASADVDEILVHVEMPNTEVNESKTEAIIWEKSDWLTSEARHLRKKEEMRLRNEAWDRRKRNIETVTRAFKLLFHAPEDGSMDDTLTSKAMALLDNPKAPELLKRFNITIETL